jgi:hypothetical protein
MLRLPKCTRFLLPPLCFPSSPSLIAQIQELHRNDGGNDDELCSNLCAALVMSEQCEAALRLLEDRTQSETFELLYGWLLLQLTIMRSLIA